MGTKRSLVVRIGAWAAFIAGAALLIKVAHIFATDGSEQLIQIVLYLGGIVLTTAGAAGLGARYGSTRPRKVALAFGAFFASLLFIMMLSDGVKAAINAVVEVPDYVATEIPVALIGLVWVIAGYKLFKSSDGAAHAA